MGFGQTSEKPPKATCNTTSTVMVPSTRSSTAYFPDWNPQAQNFEKKNFLDVSKHLSNPLRSCNVALFLVQEASFPVSLVVCSIQCSLWVPGRYVGQLQSPDLR